jgi:hypothetical protein
MAAGFRQTSAMRELERRRVNKMCEEETPNPDSYPSVDVPVPTFAAPSSRRRTVVTVLIIQKRGKSGISIAEHRSCDRGARPRSPEQLIRWTPKASQPSARGWDAFSVAFL